MATRKEWMIAEKVAAWENVAGRHPDSSKIYSKAVCPLNYCYYPSIKMEWDKYGNDSRTDWVIDHKRALNNGGSNHVSNLQAMHNYCNSVKGDN